MEIFGDRIGVLLKYGKVMGSLTKRFFYIDNEGILYYTDKDTPLQSILKYTNFDDKAFISLMLPVSKKINLHGCSVSSVKPYLENKFEQQGKSYVELYVKDRDYRSILVFAWTEEYINPLHDYIGSFRETLNDAVEEEKEIKNFNEETETNINFMTDNMLTVNELIHKKSGKIFTRDQKYMESILAKLDGKYINQRDWHKKYIKVVNGSSDAPEYEETWVELDNGSNYSGPVKNGMPHGLGKEFLPDGTLYTGNFIEGKWHGLGTITYDTLDTYQGEFIDGCICGI